MANVEDIFKKMQENPENIKYTELCKICDHYFGEARQNNTSHRVYKMPWQGNPRVNIQKSKGGKTKKYQVKQVVLAVFKLTK